MPFNYPHDYSKQPFIAGCATLTHGEVVYVKGHCEQIIADYVPVERWDGATPTDEYVVDKYNNIDSYQKAINVDTYRIVMSYDPTINTQGINEGGIVPEETPSEVE